MPPLTGFSDNPFQTRKDLVRATESLLRPLVQYFSPARGRIRIPVATGTHFDETAAQLEGFARPLWAVAPLLMGGEDIDEDLVQPWIDGFEAGTDPEHPEYWGLIRPWDQKMVEVEMISFSLLAAPKDRLWDRLSKKAQDNMIEWLQGMHDKEMPPANWLWFRVFANLALLKTCGVDTPAVRESMRIDLERLDTFYIADGWSSDGMWRSPEIDEEEWKIYQETGRAHTMPNGRNACYYSGSFAIQFSQLLYIRFAGDLDPVRTERYRQQARDFGAGFWRFFDAEGAAVPFGRSLTYRFACGGFFAALALAKVPGMPEPLDSPGAVKGFLLRHLRWWARHSENIFYADGTLNFGWIFPNMYLTEDYNSPQSVYWTLKTLVAVALTSDDPFWTEPETPYPIMTPENALRVFPAPRQITCNHPAGNHHFLLSFSQFIGIPFKAIVAKYSKFAYSSSFGFSVPVGTASLGQIAPDNTLAFSRDGCETWAVKYKAGETTFGTASVNNEVVPTGTVSWYPWVDRSVTVTTTVVPPTSRWPDWHVRIHRIKSNQGPARLLSAEGGFAINGRQKVNTLVLPVLEQSDLTDEADIGKTEGVIQNEKSVLIMSESGASGISTETLDPGVGRPAVSALKPEPNTNIMTQRTLIPLIEHDISALTEGMEVVLVSKVFAIHSEANGGWGSRGRGLRQRWVDEPQIQLEGANATGGGDFIILNK